MAKPPPPLVMTTLRLTLWNTIVTGQRPCLQAVAYFWYSVVSIINIVQEHYSRGGRQAVLEQEVYFSLEIEQIELAGWMSGEIGSSKV